MNGAQTVPTQYRGFRIVKFSDATWKAERPASDGEPALCFSSNTWNQLKAFLDAGWADQEV